MTKLTIWVDADSCPSLVRNHAVKMGNKLGLRVVFAANKPMGSEAGDFEMAVCSCEKDAADNYIFERCEPGDLVITRDIVFADRLVEKGICTINDRGTEFTREMIKERLSSRDFDLQLAQIGLIKHHHEGYDKKKFAAFANSFDKVIHKLLKS
ncbi:MAG: DUF188 domain-containing protein [Treponema sp.]|nr:DUF188 domain-containing protein [Treponema sp.]